MRRRVEQGYVLAVTIWVLAAIAMAAAFLAEKSSRALALAKQRQEIAEQRRAFADTRAEVIFRLATVPITFEGIGAGPAIALDDRPYRGTGDDVVRLQDNRGLLNLNFFDDGMLVRLLGQLGVAAERRSALIDALRDYTDDDDLRRLNGAEAAQYRMNGLPAPPNDFLLTPMQLRNVLGWREEASLWKGDILLRLVTTARVAGFNPNTAPAELLSVLPGIDPQAAAALVSVRKVTPLRSLQQLPGTASGLRLDDDYLLFAPANSVRLTHQHAKLPWMEQFSITMTPGDSRAPWRIDYFGRTAVSYVIDNADKIPSLPELGVALADGR